MARFILENLTPEQAKVFAEYFEGQGEQDCQTWFEIADVPTPYVDVFKPTQILDNGDVILQCESVE